MELLDSLVAELQSFHREKSKLLARIESCVDTIEEHDARVRNELFDLCCSFESGEEQAHHQNEELLLAQLRSTDAPIHNRIEHIADEHHAFHRIISRTLGMLRDPYVEPGTISAEIHWFLDLYERHAMNEEAIFFPIVRKHIPESLWHTIELGWHR